MKTDELRQLSDNELKARVRELKDEIFRLRLQKTSGQLEKPHLFKLYRKEVARCLTLLTERKIAAAKEKAATASK